MWKPLRCWSGKASKSKGFGDFWGICRCAFVDGWSKICFRLPWWGEENERFGKTIVERWSKWGNHQII